MPCTTYAVVSTDSSKGFGGAEEWLVRRAGSKTERWREEGSERGSKRGKEGRERA